MGRDWKERGRAGYGKGEEGGTEERGRGMGKARIEESEGKERKRKGWMNGGKAWQRARDNLILLLTSNFTLSGVTLSPLWRETVKIHHFDEILNFTRLLLYSTHPLHQSCKSRPYRISP